MSKEIMTEKEAAKYLGFSVYKLRSDRMKGKGVPYRKIGRSVRYFMSDIQEWLDKFAIKRG